MKTRKEVEDLKRNWTNDPIWDIENTDGFEEYRDELKSYSDAMKLVWEERHKGKLAPVNDIKNDIDQANFLFEDRIEADKASALALIAIAKCLAYFVEKDVGDRAIK